MAVDALGLVLTDRKKEGQEIPITSSITNLDMSDGILVTIEMKAE